MSQKQEAGCPVGLLSMALFDKYYDEGQAKNVEHGMFPWYADPALGRPHQKFPTGLCLIVKEAVPIEFEIRSVSKFFHIVSEKFVELMNTLGEDFDDVEAIDVLDPKGNAASSKRYSVAIFKRVELQDALDMGQSEIFPRRRGLLGDRVRKFHFRSDFVCSAFQLKGMAPGHDTVYCSEKFMGLARAAAFKGVEFVPTEGNASGAFTQI
jgi:hypothetical protein